jgi:hypothetical protein
VLELLLPPATERDRVDLGGLVRLRIPVADQDCDTHRDLDTGEHAGRDVRLVPFRTEIDNPDFIGDPTHVGAHLREAWAVGEAGGGDEGHHTARLLGLCLEHLPQCPAPEVHIQVVEVDGVQVDVPVVRAEVVEDGALTARLVAPPHPAAGALGRAVPVIRRVA